ncbi:hypothetical protein GCM10022254_01850 [Actinomadura meridiana]|uniref:Uncharacterized protein n=1 Tax=Actinomadura meridiana TaxID=559626 RepID=A0ABP8BS61_9ACTN
MPWSDPPKELSDASSVALGASGTNSPNEETRELPSLTAWANCWALRVVANIRFVTLRPKG